MLFARMFMLAFFGAGGFCGRAVSAPTQSTPSSAPSRKEARELPDGCLRQLGEVRVLGGGHVLALAFAPDGKTLVAGSWDSKLYMWDVSTGKELRRVSADNGLVNAVAFSRDGATLATNGQGGRLRLWQGTTGKLQPRQCLDLVFGAILAPNGKLLAAQGRMGLYVWDLTTGKSVQGNGSFETPIGFTRDSKKVICRSFRGPTSVVIFRDAATGKEVGQVATGQDSFGPDTLAPNGTTLPFTRGPNLYLYDLGTSKIRQQARPSGVSFPIESLAFSANGKMLAFQGSDEIIHVWETISLQERCRFQGRQTGRVPLAFSPDAAILASGSADSTVLLWDLGRTGSGRVATGAAEPKELAGLWQDLASADAARAYRAMMRMRASPSTTLTFLKKQLPPAAEKIDVAKLERLLRDLSSDKFSVREKASKEMAQFSEASEPLLRKALAKNAPLEMRRRVERVLDRIEQERSHPSVDHLRIIRAVEVVQTIGGPAARELLASWGQGTPAVVLTREAHAAGQ
jgi:hypothetical protein